MCGRFTLVDLSQFTDMFPWIKAPGAVAPRYNIAPTQPILAAIGEQGEYRLEPLIWGLVPHWARDCAAAAKMINARCETAAEKPAFAQALRQRRALIPASGFYEWKRQGRKGQPYYITRADRAPMLLAGLWDTWQDPQGPPIKSCTILTTASAAPVAALHDRMPLVLEAPGAERWLRAPEEATRLLRPADTRQWLITPVSPRVNRAGSEGADLILPQDGEQRTLF